MGYLWTAEHCQNAGSASHSETPYSRVQKLWGMGLILLHLTIRNFRLADPAFSIKLLYSFVSISYIYPTILSIW